MSLKYSYTQTANKNLCNSDFLSEMFISYFHKKGGNTSNGSETQTKMLSISAILLECIYLSNMGKGGQFINSLWKLSIFPILQTPQCTINET